jgi:hypothetical protein
MTTYAAIDSLVELLRCSTNRESQTLPDGTLLIGKLSPRSDGLFQEAYLHEVYAPLSRSDVTALAELIGRAVPQPLSDFYTAANGLSMFCGSLTIRGLRPQMNRTGAARYPVSLSYGNKIEISEGDGDSDRIVFGFYSDGEGYEVSILPSQDNSIVLTPRRRTGPHLRSWSSFSAFLSEEAERLSKAFVERAGVCDPLNVLPAPKSA